MCRRATPIRADPGHFFTRKQRVQRGKEHCSGVLQPAEMWTEFKSCFLETWKPLIFWDDFGPWPSQFWGGQMVLTPQLPCEDPGGTAVVSFYQQLLQVVAAAMKAGLIQKYS